MLHGVQLTSLVVLELWVLLHRGWYPCPPEHPYSFNLQIWLLSHHCVPREGKGPHVVCPLEEPFHQVLGHVKHLPLVAVLLVVDVPDGESLAVPFLPELLKSLPLVGRVRECLFPLVEIDIRGRWFLRFGLLCWLLLLWFCLLCCSFLLSFVNGSRRSCLLFECRWEVLVALFNCSHSLQIRRMRSNLLEEDLQVVH